MRVRSPAAGRVDQHLVPVDPHVRRRSAPRARRAELAAKIDDDGLRPADGNADVLDRRCARRRSASFDLERRRPSARGRCWIAGDVVARERVVGPAGQQQHRAVGIGAEVERQRVALGVAADLVERGSRPDSVRSTDASRGEHVVPVIVDARATGVRAARRRERERRQRRFLQPFVRDRRRRRRDDRPRRAAADRRTALPRARS